MGCLLPWLASGELHLADTQACTCEDHKNRGADCAHILAVRLHVAQVKAKASLRARRPRQPAEQRATSDAYAASMADHVAASVGRPAQPGGLSPSPAGPPVRNCQL